ncbi:bifunctional oligoribonuclease/PAP phosphatase NrnA [Marivirga atlantica]|jgi:phosphoesterase RecJ-like protein|uniref:Bifunctional oligoribonuclease/PAP phosphatase NrnA n=1 Tax=Marivirga atlantica TaxID=1548457 RepID=A0A937DG07_9BACT|nr:bifunctional oligoribonuclease/PAP phosphatase NrnA [Marivirga atlantica]MBL0764268.1 bifunctional oligoribonuclease/PAP phosphatase NrnA [Marivirga atlantica]
MQEIAKLKEVLKAPQNIIITTHHKPDADALGSSLGLYNYLISKGHTVKVISPSDYPDFLKWMKGNSEVIVYDEEDGSKSKKLVEEADIIFCLDFSVLNRINGLGEYVREAKAVKVLIDHHRDPEAFADYGSHDIHSASTAQLVYKMIVSFGDKALITKDIAECFYAGIMTDTGSFKHPNTNKEVHEIVAQLIDLGADNSEVSRLIYDTNSLDRLKFLGFALSERLQVYPEYHAAFFAVSMEDLKKFNSKTGDTEGLVNYALSINGITMAALFTETEDGTKLSLRSIGDFEVNTLANQYFSGGGHKNAAGGKTDRNLSETVELFKKIIVKYNKELENKTPIESYDEF